MDSLFKNNIYQLQSLLTIILSDDDILGNMVKAAKEITISLKSKNKVISIGNGGSMTDAMHFTEELTGRFRNDRSALPAICPSSPAYLTCVANDYGYENVFERYIESLGYKNDVLIAISTSGKSENILKAAKLAKIEKMIVVSLTGNDGGALKNISDININIPHEGYSDRTQEIHMLILHSIVEYVENSLFYKNKTESKNNKIVRDADALLQKAILDIRNPNFSIEEIPNALNSISDKLNNYSYGKK